MRQLWAPKGGGDDMGHAVSHPPLSACPRLCILLRDVLDQSLPFLCLHPGVGFMCAISFFTGNQWRHNQPNQNWAACIWNQTELSLSRDQHPDCCHDHEVSERLWLNMTSSANLHAETQSYNCSTATWKPRLVLSSLFHCLGRSSGKIQGLVKADRDGGHPPTGSTRP